MLVGLDEILNDHARRKGLFSLTVQAPIMVTGLSCFGVCVQAEHRGRSCLPHRGWAAVREPLVK